MKYKRGKFKKKVAGINNAKNGTWSRMIHKWWLRFNSKDILPNDGWFSRD